MYQQAHIHLEISDPHLPCPQGMVVREALSGLFEEVYDAWVFIDEQGDMSLAPDAVREGMDTLGVAVNEGVMECLLQESSSKQGTVDVEAFLKVLAWHALPGNGMDLDSLLDEAWEKRPLTSARALRMSAGMGKAGETGEKMMTIGTSHANF